jgi:hypothetical protein
MRRLLHILLSAAALLSLLLCVASMALWVRSYWTCDGIHGFHPTKRVRYAVACSRGRVACQTDEPKDLQLFTGPYQPGKTTYDLTPPPDQEWENGWGVPLEVSRTFMGFTYMRATRLGVISTRMCVIPLWFVTLVTALAPTAYALRARTHRRRAKGLCPKCGYDLRATPERCPECGTPTSDCGQRVHKLTGDFHLVASISDCGIFGG